MVRSSLIMLGLVAALFLDGCQNPQEAPRAITPGAVVCFPGLPGCDVTSTSPDGAFTLSCTTGSLVREQTLTCTASNTNGSLAHVTGWTFTSDSIAVPIVRSPPGATTTQWTGPMVISGTIAASGVVAGTQETATIAIDVTPRDWSAKIAQHQPSNDVTFTTTDMKDGRPPDIKWLGHGWEDAALVGGSPFVVPSDGPNEGLAVYDDIPILAGSNVAYDYVALQAGSVFQSFQPTTGHCNQARVVSIIPDVKFHEGFSNPPDPDHSHAGVFLASVDSIGRRVTEGLLALNGRRTAAAVVLEVKNSAESVSRAFDDDLIANTFSVADDGSRSCDFNYR